MYVSITVFQTAAQVLFCSVPLGFFSIASLSNSPNCIQVDLNSKILYSTCFVCNCLT
jgi:hypothetical protein